MPAPNGPMTAGIDWSQSGCFAQNRGALFPAGFVHRPELLEADVHQVARPACASAKLSTPEFPMQPGKSRRDIKNYV